MRMTWRRELRWLIATYLIACAWRLLKNEASHGACVAFGILARNLKNDPKFDTVRMRRKAEAPDGLR